ncbi:MAG: alpha/beta fold hydrolase [Marinicaulis sp.]|nr:alpha/beta fold hydrolase [Marinicaulis sp.]
MRHSKTGVCLIASLTAFFNLGAAKADEQRTIEVDGVERWFLVERPEGLAENSPLVVLLHGGTQNMQKTLSQPAGKDWLRLAKDEGFLLIAPNGSNTSTGATKGRRLHWNDHREPAGAQSSKLDDVAFIRDVIEWAAVNHKIDRDRVYVAGGSNGGMMTFRLLIEAPEIFAAGASFIANLPHKTPTPVAAVPTPVMLINGTDDPLMRWDGGMVGARDQQDVVYSVDATRKWWLDHNNAYAEPTNVRVVPDRYKGDDCRISIARHAGADDGADVVIVTMEGGGHVVPSRSHPKRQRRFLKKFLGPACRDANGAALAWKFFADSSGK